MKNLEPMLLPFEEKKFKKYAKKIATPHRDLFVLKRKAGGFCVFQNEKSGKCKIYKKRPIDCRIFPYNFDFTRQGKLKLMLDKKVCPRVKNGKYDKKKIMNLVEKHVIPDDYKKSLWYVYWY